MSFCATFSGFPRFCFTAVLVASRTPAWHTFGRINANDFQIRLMRLNAFFPTRDIGTDPAKIRDWAQAAEDLGYAHIEVPDHVFGATARDGWMPIYNEKDRVPRDLRHDRLSRRGDQDTSGSPAAS